MTLSLGSIGAVLAIVVLVLAIVLFAVGQLPLIMAGMFALLAVARLT